MNLQVLYFAGLREALGVSGERVEVPDTVRTAGDLREHLVHAQGRAALATAKNLRCAINQEMAHFDVLVKTGDEVAFFPPVTGG